MNPLSSFIARHKAYLYALMVILALTSTVTLCYGTYKLGKQGEQLKQLADANKRWAESWAKMNELREAEQKNAEALQLKLDAIVASSHTARQKLKELEGQNEEARDFLDTRLHPDVAGLLNDR